MFKKFESESWHAARRTKMAMVNAHVDQKTTETPGWPRTPNLQFTVLENSPELLTVGEVAARLRVKDSWVYSHADDLGVYRLGKYLRFSWQRVLDRLETLGRQPNDLD